MSSDIKDIVGRTSSLTLSDPNAMVAAVSASKGLVSIPRELIVEVAAHLSNSDIKSLRRTCKLVNGSVSLRLKRVFLSSNPLNIQVFKAIADHKVFRKEVIEIIWDDARLTRYDTKDCAVRWVDSKFEMFLQDCEESKFQITNGCGLWRPILPARKISTAQLPPAMEWAHYEELLRQEDEVLKSGADSEALQYGLKRFPALKRIAITDAAHGYLGNPLYETPMIRALPHSFNYPIPHSWPTRFAEAAPRWDADHEKPNAPWRGFRIIMKAIAQQKKHRNRISELIIDDNQLQKGLNCRVFDKPGREYNDFVALIRQPAFSRLHLCLHVVGQHIQDWRLFKSGYLRRALERAKGLEYMNLQINVTRWGPEVRVETFHSLRCIFPIDHWPQLRYFGMSGIPVHQDDVVSFLSEMPTTLRTVELSSLLFLDDGGSYRDMLTRIRRRLHWGERAVAERPRVIIGTNENLHGRCCGELVWVDNEIQDFLYGNGVNPFGDKDGKLPWKLREGLGTKRREFEPVQERPHSEWRV